MAKTKGKALANLTKSRKAALKSNKKGCPKGAKSPGPEYGHGKSPASGPAKIW